MNDVIIPSLLSDDLVYTLPLSDQKIDMKFAKISSIHQVRKNDAIENLKNSMSITGAGPKPQDLNIKRSANAIYPLEPPNGKTVMPIEQGKFIITSKLSPARTIFGVTRPHYGYDLAAAKGTPVRAVKDGVVVAIRSQIQRDSMGRPIYNADGSVKLTGYGNYVIIKHDDGTFTKYAHLSTFNKNPLFKVGARIGAGTVIGEVGSTGRSTGNHLHFELRDKNNKILDPGHLIL